jgi:hypothetical protein
LTSAGIKKSSTKDLIYYFKIKIFFSRKNIFKLSVPFSSLEPSRKPQSSTISSLTTGSKIQSTITPSVYVNPTTHIRIGTHNYKSNEIKSKLTSTKFNHLSGTDNRPLSMSTEWSTMLDKQATEKVKRIVYDETKNRNEVDLPTQIRSYPTSTSISRQRQVKDSLTTKATNSTNSTFINKKSKCF